MKARLEDKYKAIELRRKGATYKDIMQEIPVSKSLLSGWFKYLELSPEEDKQLKERAKINKDNGNSRAAISNRAKRIAREEKAYQEALEIFKIYKTDPDFILGIGLYWAEGSKKSNTFHFVNSDPKMIKFMMFWLKKYLLISDDRIFLRINTHEDFKSEKYEDFWQKELKLLPTQLKNTCYKSNTRHGIFKKNPSYKGCARIEVSKGTSVFRKTMSFINIKTTESNLEVL